MLATTAAGDAYPFAEYERMLAAAGFARSEFRQLSPTPQQAVVSHKECGPVAVHPSGLGRRRGTGHARPKWG
jgi:hypothetical protein